MLTSLWSLNIRFNSLICSILSVNNHLLNSGLVITRGLSYYKCRSILLPLIFNSSSLFSSIQRIHFDGRNSSAYDLCYEWLFNDKNILYFPNLKSLSLTQCGSIRSVVQSLLYLIEYQLDNLTLTFANHGLQDMLYYSNYRPSITSNKEKIEEQMIMFEQLLYKLFSGQCHLTSLRLDISSDCRDGEIHQCLKPNSYLSSKFIQYQHQSCCLTLRHLYIRFHQTGFLENLIEHVPNLEQLSIEYHCSLGLCASWKSNIETLKQSKMNWFDKVPKLRYFILKAFVYYDSEFVYLKWLLNNLNYIEKLQLHIKNDKSTEKICQNTWKSLIDANFVYQYCLPDIIPNLIDFDFYICSKRQLSLNDIEKIINSFKIHSFFIEHQWTNVKCLFDSIMSCQHIFSSFNNTFQSSNSLINYYSCIFNWSDFYEPRSSSYPSLHFFLEQYNELSSNVSYINIYESWANDSDLEMSLEILSKMRQNKKIDIPFRNVTKIVFGPPFDRIWVSTRISEDRNKMLGKILAHLISMTIQLKYLLVGRFEWLSHVVEYASNELGTNALSTVQYTEFRLPSCHCVDHNEGYIGKQLVPFLSTYMPHLQTLRLWRPDDFPWTSIRPAFKKYLYQVPYLQWLKSLKTPESIAQHATIFEQDLSQLIKNLKEFTFLEIFGEISYEKVESYRLMAQALFPHSQVDVGRSRFQLWL